MDERATRRSKSAELAISIGTPGAESCSLQRPHFTASASRSYASRFFCPHDGHLITTPRSSSSTSPMLLPILVRSRLRRGPTFRAAHQQDERNESNKQEAEQLEDADERYHRRLALNHAEERRVGPIRGGHRVGASCHECRAHLVEHALAGRVVGSHVRPKHRRCRLTVAR